MRDQDTKSVRENYDRIAEEYARRIFHELEHKPFDRELLNRFAAQVRDRGEVCDMGCGPGHVARYLHEAGAKVFGLDLSPRMIENARKLNPDLTFRVGNTMDLDLEEASLAGIAAHYSIVNIPQESLPLVFGGMNRALRPDGQLFLAFHMGDGVTGEDELWGHPISMEFFLFRPAQIQRQLELAAFAIEDIIERQPYPNVEYQSRRAYIFARKAASA